MSDSADSLADPGRDRIDRLHKRYDRWLTAVLRRRFGQQDSDDLVQDTWLRLASSYKLAELAHPKAFLLRVAMNVAANRHRKRTMGGHVEGLAAQFDRVEADQNDVVLLSQIIVGLPGGLRDRIVVGEMRDGSAALETLKSWNTGHPGGLSTLHANSADDALRRIEDLALEIAVHPPRRAIGQAVDLIAHIRRTAEGRRLEAVIAVNGVSGEAYDVNVVA